MDAISCPRDLVPDCCYFAKASSPYLDDLPLIAATRPSTPSRPSIKPAEMGLLQLALGLLVALSPLVSATALTYKLSPNEKACFFANVDTQPAKVAFYFAVRA